MSMENCVTLFRSLCLFRLSSIGRQVLDSIDDIDFIRSIYTSLLTPLITRQQETSTALFQGTVDKLSYEAAHTGISPTQAYDIVAGVEAFVLKDIVETIPHVDDDDFHIDSVSFGSNNTVYIYAFRQKDTSAADTRYKTR